MPKYTDYATFVDWQTAWNEYLDSGLPDDEKQQLLELQETERQAAYDHFQQGVTPDTAIALRQNQMAEDFIGYEDITYLESGGPEYARLVGQNPDLKEQAEAWKYLPGTRKILQSDALENLQRLNEKQRIAMAYDMFVNVTGAYKSFEDIFDEDNKLNMETFMDAWAATYSRALQAGPAGMNISREYVDILMRPDTRSVSDAELQSMMEAALSEAPQLSTDPGDLKALYQNRLGILLGRRPNTADERRMLQFMAEQEAARPTASQVTLLDEFIEEDMPGQYAASESGRFEQGIMSVIRNATSGGM